MRLLTMSLAAALAVNAAPVAFAAEESSNLEDWPELVSTALAADVSNATAEESAEAEPEPETSSAETSVEAPEAVLEIEPEPETSSAETSVEAPEAVLEIEPGPEIEPEPTPTPATAKTVQQEKQPESKAKVSENPPRTDLKPYTIKTEIVVEKEAKKSAKKGKSASKSAAKSTEDSEIGSITSHSYSTTSAKPKLTLVKQQAVNGGEKTSESVKARPGDTITYYLTLTNDESSESAAKDVDIVDDIPKGMKYVEGSAVGDATVSNGSVRWTIGSLKAGQSVLVSYQASIPEDAEAATYSGTANASCYIESSEDSPKTADENQPGLWLASTTASIGTALGGAAAIRRKRRG